MIYGGSNTVITRRALEDVGGFYEKSITEDFATGILIQKKGYVCYALNEVLASGLSPTDLKSLISQRVRWARGCICRSSGSAATTPPWWPHRAFTNTGRAIPPA